MHVDLTLEDILEDVLLLFWIFCCINLSDKLIFFCFILSHVAVLFFHCSIIEKGLLSRFVSDSCVRVSPISNSPFVHMIHTKNFSKKIFVLFTTGQNIFLLYLYCPAELSLPSVYTAAVYETELK